MIDKFVKYVPAAIGVDMRKQYDGLLPTFNSYIRSESDFYSEVKKNQDFAQFMLAFAIFYSSVIIPLREASSCFRDMQSYGEIQSISIGKASFSIDASRTIQRMYTDLLGLLSGHGISESVLLFSDMKDFARRLNFHLKLQSYEQ